MTERPRIARPPRPLRFLHLSTFYPPEAFGGDAMYVYRLAHALADEGHVVDVVHCADAYHLLHPEPPPIQYDEHPRVRRHTLRSGVGWLSPLVTHQTGRPLLVRRQLASVLSSGPFDVAHYHNTSLLGPGSLGLPIAGDPVRLYTAHEHWLVCPMHVLFKLGAGPCDRPQCLRCTLHGRRPPQLWRHTGLLERSARHVDTFIAPSIAAATMHRERGFSRPLVTLPYFLDRADRDWQWPGPRPHAAPYCLIVGRLEKLKGLQHVLPAWARVTGCDLLVVGAGSDERELRELAEADTRIHLLGPRSQQELGPLWVHALATIVTTATYETFGFTILESLARKTPVIVRALGALEEVGRESGGALLYRDAGELVAHVERLQRDPTLRAELANRGYETFVRQWTREAHLERYFGLLGDAALRRHGRVPWSAPSSAVQEASYS